MKQVFETTNLKFKYICMWGVLPTSTPRFNTLTYKVIKIIIQFKKLDQNIQRYLDKTLRRKEQICPILDSPVHCL